jgi:hypothetical protein
MIWRVPPLVKINTRISETPSMYTHRMFRYMISLFQPLQLYLLETYKNFFFNDLLFIIAYFIMFCKVLTAVLKHPLYTK